jgi:hypothetical protein
VRVDEDVGRLEVAVKNTAHMHIVHAHQHAKNDFMSLRGGKRHALLVENIEKSPIGHQLGEEKTILGVCACAEYANDVAVTQIAQHVALPEKFLLLTLTSRLFKEHVDLWNQ